MVYETRSAIRGTQKWSMKPLPTTILITKIVRSLRDNPIADQTLVGILAEHILKIDAANTAAYDATDAVEKLALERGELNT